MARGYLGLDLSFALNLSFNLLLILRRSWIVGALDERAALATPGPPVVRIVAGLSGHLLRGVIDADTRIGHVICFFAGVHVTCFSSESHLDR